MSVSDSNVIDIISTDPNGNIFLTISDHLEWDEELEHIPNDSAEKFLGMAKASVRSAGFDLKVSFVKDQ
jgi:hypothetical protein